MADNLPPLSSIFAVLLREARLQSRGRLQAEIFAANWAPVVLDDGRDQSRIPSLLDALKNEKGVENFRAFDVLWADVRLMNRDEIPEMTGSKVSFVIGGKSIRISIPDTCAPKLIQYLRR